MIQLSNTTAQTLTPGQAITFDKTLLHTGCGECHRANTSSVKMRAMSGTYEVAFGANIGAEAANTAVQLSIQIGGDTLPESTMISTTAAVGDLNSVSRVVPVRNTCGDYSRVTIVNTGTVNVTVGANSTLFIKRIS